jgi:hypothetical protein
MSPDSAAWLHLQTTDYISIDEVFAEGSAMDFYKRGTFNFPNAHEPSTILLELSRE